MPTSQQIYHGLLQSLHLGDGLGSLDTETLKYLLDKYGYFTFKNAVMQKEFVWTDELVAEFVRRSESFYNKGHYFESAAKWFKANKTPKPESVPDYEILQYKAGNLIYNYNGEGGYLAATERNSFIYSSAESVSAYPINQVRRLSDNEVFTVGQDTEQGKIESFSYSLEDGLHVHVSNMVTPWDYPFKISEVTVKKRKLIATTNDGVDIFEGDEFAGVEKGTFDIMKMRFKPMFESKWLLFSTIGAACHYVLINKPRLSINDVFTCCHDDAAGGSTLYLNETKLIELAKQKLKQQQ